MFAVLETSKCAFMLWKWINFANVRSLQTYEQVIATLALIRTLGSIFETFRKLEMVAPMWSWLPTDSKLTIVSDTQQGRQWLGGEYDKEFRFNESSMMYLLATDDVHHHHHHQNRCPSGIVLSRDHSWLHQDTGTPGRNRRHSNQVHKLNNANESN